MLSGQSLVYFSPGQWDGLWRNRHQLMSIFGRENKVLWVERRPHLRETLDPSRSGPAARLNARTGWRGSVRQIAGGLHVYSYPAWAPISGRAPLRQLTRAIRRNAISSAMRALGLSQPIVWFSHPRMVDLVGEMPPASLLLYHVVDEYTAYSGVTAEQRRRTEALERQMMAMVDAVIVVSEELYRAKRPYNEHTYLVPNGVDYAAYSAALEDPNLPPELAAIPAPRLGYSGLIGDRLDLGMLQALAQEHPEWSLVFLGEARVAQQAQAWQAMLSLPNVHHLGQVDVARVPHYLKGFQVGLMPYAPGRESENISPLKLYDYLAAGLPVASTDISAARAFSRYIHLAGSADDSAAGMGMPTHDWARAVTDALADSAPDRRQERRQVAASHTWEQRVEQLSHIIDSLARSGDRSQPMHTQPRGGKQKTVK